MESFFGIYVSILFSFVFWGNGFFFLGWVGKFLRLFVYLIVVEIERKGKRNKKVKCFF